MSRVLMISHDQIGSRMAGPGIRYRELARALSREFDVLLAVPGETDLPGDPLSVISYRPEKCEALVSAARTADVIVTCGDTLVAIPQLLCLERPLVVDGYDPHTLETLALWASEPDNVQIARHAERQAVLDRQCTAGDFFICASERQRDWWLGALERAGRIHPAAYAVDPSLRRLVDVVPFGLPAEPPRAERPVLRGAEHHLRTEDRILLWGGGLWQWLDPLTAVRAVARLANRSGSEQSIRLVFPGTRHPNPGMPDMPVRRETIALAEDLGLVGSHILFGDWVAYDDWPAVLLESDVGLSLHPDTAEARLAFRTRVLDYIWAGLPMVVTRGDVLSEMVEQYGLGLTVDPGDDAGVAAAVLEILSRPRAEWRPAFDRARLELTWERAVEPLAAFCRAPRRSAGRSPRADSPLGVSAAGAAQSPATGDLERALSERDGEIRRLRQLVAGYESGRFIRVMRWLDGCARRVRQLGAFHRAGTGPDVASDQAQRTARPEGQ